MKDKYMGERFLHEVYATLYKNDSVKHAVSREMGISEDIVERKVPEHYRRIRLYLERIEKMHDRATTEELKNYLKRLYYDEYVVKEENLPTTMSDVVKKSRIEEQKKSLAAWIDYLMDSSLEYPMWLKYWLLHEVLKMGAYKDGKYMTRTDSTFVPFLDVDPVAVEVWFHDILKRMDAAHDSKDIRFIIRDFNFAKMYAEYERKSLEKIKSQNEGKWIKYQMGSEEDAMRLCNSLQGKTCKWCTSNPEMAKNQVSNGDFYVFYTKDIDGLYVNPRIAIRMNGKEKIGEIRGLGEAQELEYNMMDPLVEKLMDMPFLSKEDVQRNLDKVNHLKKLQEMKNKTFNGEELSVEEVILLYTHKFGFGFQNENQELIQLRNFVLDYHAIKESNFPKEEKYPLLDKFIRYNLSDDSLPKIEDDAFQMYMDSNGQYGLLALSDEHLDNCIEMVKKSLHNTPADIKRLPDGFKKNHQDLVLEVYKSSSYGFEDLTEETLDKNIEIIADFLKKHSFYVDLLSKEFKLRHQDLVLEAFKSSDYLYGFEDLTEETLEKNMEIIANYLKKYGYYLANMSKEFKLRHQDLVLDVFKSSNYKYGFLDLTEETMDENFDIIADYILKNGSILNDLSKEFKLKHQDFLLEIVKTINGSWIEYLPEEVIEANFDSLKSLLKRNPFCLQKLSKEFKLKHQDLLKEESEDELTRMINESFEIPFITLDKDDGYFK